MPDDEERRKLAQAAGDGDVVAAARLLAILQRSETTVIESAVLAERAKWVEAISRMRMSSSLKVQQALDVIERRATDSDPSKLEAVYPLLSARSDAISPASGILELP